MTPEQLTIQFLAVPDTNKIEQFVVNEVKEFLHG
jgi:hypothetical protein